MPMANTYDFGGRVALVTGGASGIGAATAARLREGGAGVAVFDRPGIENCDDLFAFKCPRKWERLRAAGRADVRSCDVCRKDVYYCHTIGEARAHAREGRCVAVAQTVERLHNDLSERAPGEYCGLPVLGRLRVPDDPPPVITRRPWWKFW